MGLLRAGIVLAVASAAVLAVAGNEEPQDDSNFGVQIGMLKYLASYYEQYTPPFGIIAGKATLFRMVSSPYTRVSVSFGVGLSLELNGFQGEDLANTQFQFKLHSRPCEESGGPVYQHPYSCQNGCSAAEIASARNGDNPLELEFALQVDTSNFNEASLEVEWAVHIPDSYNGQRADEMSVVMYDPINNVPMVCADLKKDRSMEGLIFTIFEDRIDNVPVIDTSLTRDERGFTELAMRAANLRPSYIYRAYVHSLPCVPLSQTSLSIGGDRYMRDISCYGRIGTEGCQSSEENQMWLTLVSDQIGIADVKTRFSGLARADAQSLLLKDCLDPNGDPDPTGRCDGEEPTLMCIDLVDEIPRIASSSSASPGTLAPIELTNSPATSNPTNPPTRLPTTLPPTRPPTTRPPTTRHPTPSPSDPPRPETPEPSPSPTTSPTPGTTTAMPGQDRETVAPVDRIPGTQAPLWAGKNPCPELHSYYRRSSKGKRGVGSKHEQLEFSPIDVSEGMCCMDPDGPAANLIAMAFPDQQGAKGTAGSGIAGIVAGVAGGILLAGGMALAVLRKRREEHRFKALDDYAVPN